jgi:NADPH-dependent 2,4-dienoyl-CoA reductase/sulfur reductase-like enzyme
VDARRVRLAGGEKVPFDGLVIATGARARRLAEGGGEIVLRSLDDALALRPRLARAGSVLIEGGGFLGMEIASVSRGLGLDVTVVDIRPPLVAALGPWLAQLFTEAARDHGVRLAVSSGGVGILTRADGASQTSACGVGIVTRAGEAAEVSPCGVELSGGASGGSACGVELADGTRLHADLVVTAAGDRPNTEWLARSGLPIDGGVLVDSRCRVTDRIVAAGDVAAFPVSGGRPRRMPHWDSAITQAKVAACALLLGDGAPAHQPDPYYWTEAFGLAVKIAGPLPVTGPPTVLEGDLAARSALLRWTGPAGTTAVAMKRRMSVAKLRRLATA